MPIFEKTPKENLRFPTGQGQPFPKPSPTPKPSPIPRPSPIQRPGPIQKPMVKKPSLPKTLFEEKKDWTRADFLNRATKAPFNGKGYHERKKMLDQAFPSRRFSTYISEGEAKTRLRELRREEYRAKTGAEKSKLGGIRKYLEKQTDLKGKY